MNITEFKTNLETMLQKLNASLEGTVSFRTRSGGMNYRLVNQANIVFEQNEFAYHTQACGDAYETNLTLKGEKIGVDKKGKQVFKLNDGQIVAYKHYSGDASSFDYGEFTEPEL